MRYKLHGKWTPTLDFDMGPVTIERNDLIDERGNVFNDGAYRVKKDGRTVKTFKGETAWSDAARLANDLYFDWRLTR